MHEKIDLVDPVDLAAGIEIEEQKSVVIKIKPGKTQKAGG